MTGRTALMLAAAKGVGRLLDRRTELIEWLLQVGGKNERTEALLEDGERERGRGRVGGREEARERGRGGEGGERESGREEFIYIWVERDAA